MGKENKKKILLVEDDMATIEVYKRALEQAGFEVNPIITGGETVRRLQKMDKDPSQKPDLVLLDLILPDMDGIDILKVIRGLDNVKDVKVFILTNYGDKELEAKGLLLKTERYILKTDCVPTNLAKLVKKELK